MNGAIDRYAYGLRQEAQTKTVTLEDEEPAIFALFLNALYEDKEDERIPEGESYLICWSKVYVLGEKYLSPAAKHWSSNKIEKGTGFRILKHADIRTALDLVYNSGPTGGWESRRPYQSIIATHQAALFRDSAFQELLKANPV